MARVVQAARGLFVPSAARPLSDLLPGRLAEASGGPGSARLTFAASLVRRTQIEGETTAWIQREDGVLFPPDLEEAGVDLTSLVVVRTPLSPADGMFRAAEILLDSGAFGLVILDVRGARPRISPSVQGRLLSAAREHRSRVLFLTEKPAASDSLGSLVGLRLEPRRVRVGAGTFVLETRVLKNKQGLPLDEPVEHRRGPWGLE
jgi:recombination protein RecA